MSDHPTPGLPSSPADPPPRSGGTVVSRVIMFVALAALVGIFSYRIFHGDRPWTGPADSTAESIPWRTDLDAALAESKATGKPVLVDFSAVWCGPCQEMKHHVWPDPQVSQVASTKYIPVLMDVDKPESRAPSHRYGIEFIPAVFILNSDGNVIRQGAFMSKAELLDFLQTRTRAH